MAILDTINFPEYFGIVSTLAPEIATASSLSSKLQETTEILADG